VLWIDVKNKAKDYILKPGDRLDDVCFRLRRLGYVSIFNVVAEDRATPRPALEAVLELQGRLCGRSKAVKDVEYRRQCEANFRWRRTYDRDVALRNAYHRTGRMLVVGKTIEFWRSEDDAMALLREALHLTLIKEWTAVDSPCLALCAWGSSILSPEARKPYRKRPQPDVLTPLQPDFFESQLYGRFTWIPSEQTPTWQRARWHPSGVGTPDGQHEIVRNEAIGCYVVRACNDADPRSPVLPIGTRNLPRSAAVYAHLWRSLVLTVAPHMKTEELFTDTGRRRAY
jgi:hypothetical protein